MRLHRARSDWINYLKPSMVKIGLTLLMPVVIGLIRTQRIENTLSFYGFMLNPRLVLWTGRGVVYVFNY